MRGDFPYKIKIWTGIELQVKNELTCFDYNDVTNELEGDSKDGDCNATPNGFTLHVPRFYMNSVQG